MTEEEYLAHDATGLAELVRRGEVSAGELLGIALDRIARINPALNAVVRLMSDEAIEAAKRAPSGPFGGVPFLAKDLLSDYAGHPTSAGSRLLAGYVPTSDSELARRVRASGAIVTGKTNLPEAGLLPYTESELWGPCRNPWDLGRTPGGSSGGSAAAVASGMVPMAGGGDGGGSIRIPAACCGLFGLKPTRGRTPTGPNYGLVWRGAVVEHVLTRSVRDSAAMLDATHGSDPGAPFEIAPPTGSYVTDVETDPPPLRIAWTTTPTVGATVDPNAVASVERTVELLTALGHDLIEAHPIVEGESFARAFLTMVSAELAADLADAEAKLGRKARRADVEPATWALALVADALSAREFAGALRTLERMSRDVGQFFQEYDVLLTPSLAFPPPELGAMAPSRTEDRFLRLLGAFGSGRLIRAAGLLEEAAKTAFEFTPWTPVYNVTGQPAMSVPMEWDPSGLPIGAHFVGRFGREDTLFRLAGQLERARPWFDRLPAIARANPEAT